jgi:hypothetical protein
MALNRKHFIAFARDLRDIRPPAGQEQLVAVWAHCVTVTANNLAPHSASFNRARFYEAAGMPQELIDRVAS